MANLGKGLDILEPLTTDKQTSNHNFQNNHAKKKQNKEYCSHKRNVCL